MNDRTQGRVERATSRQRRLSSRRVFLAAMPARKRALPAGDLLHAIPTNVLCGFRWKLVTYDNMVYAYGLWQAALMRRLTACVLLFAVGATAAVKRVETAWTGLGGLISSRKVALFLPGGAAIEGKAVSVEPDALERTISKTPDPRGHAKGAASIPRSSISTLQSIEMRVVGRVVVTTVGVVAGLNVGAGAGIFGLPVAGFSAGRTLDRKAP